MLRRRVESISLQRSMQVVSHLNIYRQQMSLHTLAHLQQQQHISELVHIKHKTSNDFERALALSVNTNFVKARSCKKSAMQQTLWHDRSAFTVTT